MIKLKSLLEDKYTVYFDVGSAGLMSKTVSAKNEKEAAEKVASGLKDGAKLIKKVEKESVNEEAPDYDLARALKYINNDIFRVLVKYEGKADIEKAVYSWMLGLHAKLKKFGIKLK
jgi:hypothetical protein